MPGSSVRQSSKMCKQQQQQQINLSLPHNQQSRRRAWIWQYSREWWRASPSLALSVASAVQAVGVSAIKGSIVLCNHESPWNKHVAVDQTSLKKMHVCLCTQRCTSAVQRHQPWLPTWATPPLATSSAHVARYCLTQLSHPRLFESLPATSNLQCSSHAIITTCIGGKASV